MPKARAMSRMSGRWQAQTVLAAVLALALGAWEPFRSADPDVEAGNRAYTEGRYDDALAAYDRAARRGAVDRDGLAFDRGTVLLKKAEATHDPAEKERLAARALEDLKQAGHAKDPRIRGNASYNRGNLLMGQDKLDDAIESYKQALRDDPDLDDARLNLELALRRRDQQRKQQQSQQGQRGQGQQPDQGQGSNQQGNGNGSSSGSGSGDDRGSNQQGSSGGDGSDQPQSGNGGGSSQSPNAGGDGSNRPQNGGNGQGSNAPQSGSGPRPPDRPDRSPVPQRGRPQRGRGPQSPRTPTDGKLDDLDNYSRRLQKDEARRHATGRPADPQHDW